MLAPSVRASCDRILQACDRGAPLISQAPAALIQAEPLISAVGWQHPRQCPERWACWRSRYYSRTVWIKALAVPLSAVLALHTIRSRRRRSIPSTATLRNSP